MRVCMHKSVQGCTTPTAGEIQHEDRQDLSKGTIQTCVNSTWRLTLHMRVGVQVLAVLRGAEHAAERQVRAVRDGRETHARAYTHAHMHLPA